MTERTLIIYQSNERQFIKRRNIERWWVGFKKAYTLQLSLRGKSGSLEFLVCLSLIQASVHSLICDFGSQISC